MLESLQTNTTISHYRIIEKIGAGGMGEVYLAQDTKLDRKVAPKILPAEPASNQNRMRRFEQEARAASALNHPNIITIFEIDETDSGHFIATEFIDGETLRQHLLKAAMELDDVLDIGTQIASALSAAHDAGIVHRDIKPENVMLRPDGLVKVLDFGLAKLSEPAAMADPSDSSEEATRLKRLTQAGMIMGTVAYMSPEQARGHEVDKRTDIWSLGCLLYEMLTRQQPFRGDTTTDALANIIHREPVSILELRRDANNELERIINKVLCKNREERYQTAKDLSGDLKQFQKRLEFEAELQRSSQSGIKTEAHTQLTPVTTTNQTQARNSIAVLPFSNLSADPNNEYFCDGLAEELLNALAKIDHLKVAARTSAFSFKGKNTNVSEIGQKLSVNTVLEGSVRRSGNRLRITVQLVNASDGYHLWSERYDREMQDIFDVQDEITLAVVDALKVKLFGDDKTAVLKRGTDNTEAYELYLRGLFYWNKRTKDNLEKATDLFQQAIERDPNYALGYVGLADCYVVLEEHAGVPASESLPKARAAAERALQIDDSLAEAHAALAYTHQNLWRWSEAEEEYRRAISLNPNYPTAHHWFATYFTAQRKFDDAMREIKQAQELDPLSQVINYNVAQQYLLKNDPDSAIEQCQKIIELYPTYPGAHQYLGFAYLTQRRWEEATAEFQKTVELSERASRYLRELGYCYAVTGRRRDALAILKELEEKYAKREAIGQYLAGVYAGLGDKAQAFAWLEKDFQQHSGLLPDITWEFTLEDLRSDPRYTDLLQRMGILTEENAQGTTSEAGKAQTAMLSPATINTSELSEPRAVATTGSLVKPNRRRTAISIVIIVTAVIAAVIAAVSAAVVSSYLSRKTRASIQSIAVMPFVNQSGNADLEYLSDGMTETLISSLSQLPNLSVKARSSVFRYKGKEANPQTIGRELNVQAILNGRVIQRGEQLTLSLELLDAQTENVIWSERYDRKPTDLVSLQSEIARDVSSKLKTKLSGADEQKVAKNYTADPQAYQLYLKGRFFWNKRTGESLKQAAEYYRQATEKDPNYARAYAGLAETYVLFPIYSVAMPNDSMPRAKTMALRALEIDESVAEAHAALGLYLGHFELDRKGAEREFRRAIALNPDYATAHQWLSNNVLSPTKRFDEALTVLRRAEEIDPLSPIIGANLGDLFVYTRQYDEAISRYKRVLALDPNFAFAHFTLGQVYCAKGMHWEAIAEFRKSFELDDDPTIKGFLAMALAKSGQREEAMKLLNELKQESSERYVSSNAIAFVYIGLNDKNEALSWLEKGVVERSSYATFMAVDPVYDVLRDDPRFAAMLKRLNLPE